MMRHGFDRSSFLKGRVLWSPAFLFLNIPYGGSSHLIESKYNLQFPQIFSTFAAGL